MMNVKLLHKFKSAYKCVFFILAKYFILKTQTSKVEIIVEDRVGAQKCLTNTGALPEGLSFR